MPPANPGLVDAVRQSLARHAPFDALEPGVLANLAAHLRLGYHARGTIVIGPQAGIADRLYIVKQGSVRGGAASAPAASDTVFSVGEFFPVGALVGRRAVADTYRAEQDTFCWELDAGAFHALMEHSAPFRNFCTNHLSVLLERSHRARSAEAASAAGDQAAMLAPLASLQRREPIWCEPQATLAQVMNVMRQLHVGSMIVCDAQRKPVGIFTTVDLLQRMPLDPRAMDVPISSLMTPDPVSLDAEAPIVDAVLAMARHGFRHVVVTRDGKLAGVVSERDLFALQRKSLGRVGQGVRAAQSIEALSAAAADIRAVTRHLLAQGVGAEHVTQMTSALNDALSQRVIELVARDRLPARWCWLALGSEGRLEQTLATDQDNALLFEGDADARAALLAFAGEVNLALEACGFPLCAGEIMARNPRWCLTLDEWRAQFSGWIRNPQPEALLNAAIFFDFRPLAGDAALAGELREAVLAQARAQPAFLRAMAENALQVRTPLGLLGDFAPPDAGQHAGTIDLKGYGARPIVDVARTLALARGIPATNSAARLRAVAAAGALPGAEAEAAADAFHYIQALRLRRQHLEGSLPKGTENRIDPARLNEVDQRILRAAFRQAALLQERLRADYAL